MRKHYGTSCRRRGAMEKSDVVLCEVYVLAGRRGLAAALAGAGARGGGAGRGCPGQIPGRQRAAHRPRIALLGSSAVLCRCCAKRAGEGDGDGGICSTSGGDSRQIPEPKAESRLEGRKQAGRHVGPLGREASIRGAAWLRAARPGRPPRAASVDSGPGRDSAFGRSPRGPRGLVRRPCAAIYDTCAE
jgi:hypothetical protein